MTKYHTGTKESQSLARRVKKANNLPSTAVLVELGKNQSCLVPKLLLFPLSHSASINQMISKPLEGDNYIYNFLRFQVSDLNCSASVPVDEGPVNCCSDTT